MAQVACDRGLRSRQKLALCKVFDFLCQLFDLLRFLDEGYREGRTRVGFLDLSFEFGGHFVEFSDVFSDQIPVLLINDLPFRNARIVRVRRNTVVAPIWVGTRFARGPWQLQTEENRLCGQDSESAAESNEQSSS